MLLKLVAKQEVYPGRLSRGQKQSFHIEAPKTPNMRIEMPSPKDVVQVYPMTAGLLISENTTKNSVGKGLRRSFICGILPT